MERIILLTNYPNLYGLGLYNLASETARDLFTNESFLIRIFKKQILSLVVDINKCREPDFIQDINTFIYTQIFTMFSNLQCLNFGSSCSGYHILSFGISTSDVFSSTLLELHVVVDSYKDCLYLLDGRFNQLHTFYVTICSLFPCLPITNNEKKLPNLKCFSLTHKLIILAYDKLIIPLLHRMSNLEKLGLYFVNHNKLIIDGDELEKNIINNMIKLKKFIFNIRSIVPFHNQINLLSSEDIQHTFRNFKGNEIISSIDYFLDANKCHCHVYSYPYTLTYYDDITNNFPGGLFKCVREVSLFDERPFEHEFFLQIAQSFPFMETLTLNNRKPQKNDNQQWSIIEYPCLITLDIVQVHENYVEQFLNNTKTCLPKNVNLHIDYISLQKVTNNFTRDATRMNCFTINILALHHKPEFTLYLKDYFPYAEII
ncbi:unnamed protein product [Rotaria sordida]|uniref:Uncharacterized protein n=1 Tax=Rotaria sordida TaxID=392033 RepID=A0A815Q6P6_9BILA|nr:unnamed protein product [Rotaria sordida]